MKKKDMMKELKKLYIKLKGEEVYKASLQVLKFMASVEGFLHNNKQKDKEISDLNNHEIAHLLSTFDENFNG